MGVFSWHKFLLACTEKYNRLVTAYIFKTATGVQYYVSLCKKNVTVFVFNCFSPSSFVCVRCNQPGNLAIGTTRVEDTSNISSYQNLSSGE